MTQTPVLLVPDLSEWQGSVDWAKLTAAGYPAAIIRVYNGHRADLQFERNRDQAHAHHVRALGLYAYLVADVDPVTQAKAFVSAVGKLQPGEWPILDYEAAGLHVDDAKTWCQQVGHALTGAAPWLYTSEYIYRTQDLGRTSAVPASRTWLAAWGPTEPREPHELWQYTDHRTVPGVDTPVDCSSFHGTVDQLVAAVHPAPAGKPAPGPTAHPRFPYPEGIHPNGSRPSARPLQRALKVTGWLESSVVESDHYGPLTQQAVSGFNHKHHLANHGLLWDPAIGPRGWALLMTLAYGKD